MKNPDGHGESTPLTNKSNQHATEVQRVKSVSVSVSAAGTPKGKMIA